MKFQKENLHEIIDEIFPLWEQHWKETEMYQVVPMNPDMDRYFEYSRIGYYRQYTARTDEGKLIGHAGMYVSKSMHTQVQVATEDTFFVEPAYRGKTVAARMYKYIEADLKKLGINEIHMSAKLANKAGNFMERLGFDHVSNGYLKVI